MKQPKHINEIISLTNRSSTTPSEVSLPLVRKNVLAVTSKFRSEEDFMLRVTPDTQPAFARKEDVAIMGDYPTLTDICQAYGPMFAAKWLMPQIADMSLFVGAKNLTQRQQMQLAEVIATEYYYLKVTELLLFFYRFKAGHYGRFYGSVDPMVVTCALRTFVQERNDLITYYENRKCEEEKQKEAERNRDTMNLEEWLEIKTIIAMYNPEFTI